MSTFEAQAMIYRGRAMRAQLHSAGGGSSQQPPSRVDKLKTRAKEILAEEGYEASQGSMGGETFTRTNDDGSKDFAVFYDRHAKTGMTLFGENGDWRHIAICDYISEMRPNAAERFVNTVKAKLGLGS